MFQEHVVLDAILAVEGAGGHSVAGCTNWRRGCPALDRRCGPALNRRPGLARGCIEEAGEGARPTQIPVTVGLEFRIALFACVPAFSAGAWP